MMRESAGSEHGDDVDSDLLDLDEAANVGADSGVADDEALSDGEVEEFGKNLNLGSRPFAALIRLTLLERLQWMAGFPLKNTEIAHRIMMKLDKERTGNLPLVALDFILKQIQGELPISKETFDLAEVWSGLGLPWQRMDWQQPRVVEHVNAGS